MTVNTTGAAFFNVGAGFEAAPGSSGTITLDGGTYTNTYGEVATNFNGSPSANSTGTLTLTNNASLVLEPGNPGQGLEFDVGVSFEAGYSATGNLLIEGGATLEARNTAVINTGTGTFDGGYFNINIGRNVDAKGYATVTGVGSRLTTEGGAARLTIGRNEGQGTLDIENGGFVGAFNLTIGREGIGRINVDGAGSELKTSSAYGFYSGTPQLEATGYNTRPLHNSILANFIRFFTMKSMANSQIFARMRVMQRSRTVNIVNEDGISDRAFLRLGRNYDSYGYASVDGDGSSINLIQYGLSDQAAFDNGSSLVIGQLGSGLMVVSNDAELNVLGHDAFIGVGFGSSSGSPVSGQSFLKVRSGGKVLLDSQNYGGDGLFVGNRENTDGILIISGPGSEVKVTGDLDDALEASELAMRIVIGAKGDGELLVEDGGKLILDAADDAYPYLRIGQGRNGDGLGDLAVKGLATVTGSGSSIELFGTNTANTTPGLDGLIGAGQITVGSRNLAEGELRILDGGRVSNSDTNSSMLIGNDPGSSGLVVVDGAGALLEAGNRLGISVDDHTDGTPDGFVDPSNAGVGELKITNGGSVTVDATIVGVNGVLDIDGGLD